MHHQEEINRLKGERFNVFSILKMEYRENDTHSAFIGELLNPKGSHLQGNLFLKLFLQTIKHSKLDLDTTKVVLEEPVGARSDSLKEGGRIDIYIFDTAGNTICIENKIDAVDQYAQIERYVKHNRIKNTVYYLTKEGKEATKESRGELKDGVDYFCISYKITIIEWLQQCLKESAEWPLLRESIRQYIILLKKITHQMTDSSMENQIEELIKSNYGAAKLIQENIGKAEQKQIALFLARVKQRIESELKESEGWKFSIDENLGDRWKGLRVSHAAWNGISIILMGSPNLLNSTTLFGIAASQSTWSKADIMERLATVELFRERYNTNQHWIYYQYYTLFETVEQTQQLFEDKDMNSVIDRIALKFIETGKACRSVLSAGD